MVDKKINKDAVEEDLLDDNIDKIDDDDLSNDQNEPDINFNSGKQKPFLLNISEKLSSVASTRKENIMLVAGIAIIAAITIYYVFFESDDTTVKNTDQEGIEKIDPTKSVLPPQIDSTSINVNLPALPQLPKLKAPEPPKPKKVNVPQPLVTDQIETSLLTPEDNPIPVNDSKKKARLKAKITVVGGESSPEQHHVIDSGSSEYDNIPLTAQRVKATKIGNLNRVIAQGKILDAVLESAINTDLPGLIRAVISRDIYSESGTSILIPKGSRLIGNYSAEVALGQNRVKIAWNRLIRPDGIDIVLNSLATDPLGRAGIDGHVNNKYFEMFTNTIMVSMLNIALGVWQDKQDKKDGTFTQNQSSTTHINPDGSRVETTTGKQKGKKSQAIANAGKNVVDLSKKLVQKKLNALKPTITVPQGTHIRVFVSTDLVFPSYSKHSIKVIR